MGVCQCKTMVSGSRGVGVCKRWDTASGLPWDRPASFRASDLPLDALPAIYRPRSLSTTSSNLLTRIIRPRPLASAPAGPPHPPPPSPPTLAPTSRERVRLALLRYLKSIESQHRRRSADGRLRTHPRLLPARLCPPNIV